MAIKHIILYRDDSCTEERVLHNLQKIIPQVTVFRQHCSNYDMDPELAQKLLFLIHEKSADAIFSVDFYPVLAEIAHTVGLPYIAWAYDAPHFAMYSRSSAYDTSYLFTFDREEYERLRQLGRPHVFHRPLASDPDYFLQCISASKSHSTYEISFLGSSYQSEQERFEKQGGLTEYDTGYLNALMCAQSKVYGYPFLWETLSDELQDRILHACGIEIPENYDLPKPLAAAALVEKKLSVMERRQMIADFADSRGIALFSDSEALVRDGVTYLGYADYETGMAPAFCHSRINLNLTVRGIHSGIPQRAMDIMGCGGFLLSNYQPELAEAFADGEAAALFAGRTEMLEKADWYLAHDSERERIAAEGLARVRKHFTYENALREILSAVES